MKTKLALLTILMTGISSFVFADLIAPNRHRVERYATIDNLDAYPAIVVITIITGPTKRKPERKLLAQGERMQKGYRFNSLDLVWTTRDYLKSIISLEYLPEPTYFSSKSKSGTPPVYRFLTLVDLSDKLVPDENPMISEELHYELYGDQSDPRLFLARTVMHFKDGRSLETKNPVPSDH